MMGQRSWLELLRRGDGQAANMPTCQHANGRIKWKLRIATIHLDHSIINHITTYLVHIYISIVYTSTQSHIRFDTHQ